MTDSTTLVGPPRPESNGKADANSSVTTENQNILHEATTEQFADLSSGMEQGFQQAFGVSDGKTGKGLRDARRGRQLDKYKGFFSDGMDMLRYPDNLFSQNQKNGIAFYIQVRKNSVAYEAQGGPMNAQAISTWANHKSNQFIHNTENRNQTFAHSGPQDENDTDINRSGADYNAMTRITSGAGGVAAIGAGLSFFNGNGAEGATIQKFVNKGIKVAGATAAGVYLGDKLAEANTVGDGLISTSETSFLQKIIHLHIPQAVITQYQADWNPEELGLAGALANRRATQASILETGELLGRGVISAAANIPRAAGLGNADFAGAIDAATRKTNNPFKEQLFKSIGFRKFAFSYVFSPKNVSELIEVEEIIKTFKYHMLPEISPGEMFLTYPSEFQMEFLHTDSKGTVNTNDHMPRISGCALTDVKVVYGPDGAFQTIKGTGGAPSEITMQLSFVELETLTANRIADGF